LEVLSNASWALSYISEYIEAVEIIIKNGILIKLVELIDQQNTSVLIPCLRILGNIVAGEDEYANQVLKTDAMNVFYKLLSHDNSNIRKDTCWIYSNLAGMDNK